MSTQLSPASDLVLVYDLSVGDYGSTSIFDLVNSVLSSSSSMLQLTPDSSTGTIGMSFNASALVSTTRQVSAGYGLSGGGALSGDVTLSIDLGAMTQVSALDSASDLLAYYSVGSGVTRTASISDITGGLTAALPLGSIA